MENTTTEENRQGVIQKDIAGYFYSAGKPMVTKSTLIVVSKDVGHLWSLQPKLC